MFAWVYEEAGFKTDARGIKIKAWNCGIMKGLVRICTQGLTFPFAGPLAIGDRLD
jgi:hypothetical protein